MYNGDGGISTTDNRIRFTNCQSFDINKFGECKKFGFTTYNLNEE